MMRVLRNGKETLSHRSNLREGMLDLHPEAEIKHRKLRGKLGPKQKQHCLFGWFGEAGPNDEHDDDDAAPEVFHNKY